MPSSHGGGFGGGFSGGGGFHSSGGSHSGGGTNTPRFSNKSFPGATRYAYVNPAGIMCVFYYQGRPSRVKKSSITFLAVLLAFFIILSIVIPMLMLPRKLPESYCEFTGSYYSDNAGIISGSDADELNAAFSAFYEKTGVQPYLYTIKAENFPSKYGSISSYTLEEYAYDLYEKKFNDEGHWLIVFVEYDTGHGVGYLLSVHEGPNRFRYKSPSAVMVPGMITTDEPGIYLKGKYGIRIENELLCIEKSKNEYGTFLAFEPITYCPIDTDAINYNLLSNQEKDWLNKYQQTVYEKVSPYLNEIEKKWLEDYLHIEVVEPKDENEKSLETN